MIESTTQKPYSGNAKCGCGRPAVIEINIPPMSPWYRCAVCENELEREINWQSLGEHRYEDSIICPYCGDGTEESWIIDEDQEDYECGVCGQKFDIEVRHEVTYSTQRSISDMPPDWNGDDE